MGQKCWPRNSIFPEWGGCPFPSHPVWGSRAHKFTQIPGDAGSQDHSDAILGHLLHRVPQDTAVLSYGSWGRWKTSESFCRSTSNWKLSPRLGWECFCGSSVDEPAAGPASPPGRASRLSGCPRRPVSVAQGALAGVTLKSQLEEKHCLRENTR